MFRLNALENAKKAICIVGLTERLVHSHTSVIDVSTEHIIAHVNHFKSLCHFSTKFQIIINNSVIFGLSIGRANVIT